MNTSKTNQYIPAAALTLFARSPNATEYLLACSAQLAYPGIRFSESMIAISWALMSFSVSFFAYDNPWMAMFHGTMNFCGPPPD